MLHTSCYSELTRNGKKCILKVSILLFNEMKYLIIQFIHKKNWFFSSKYILPVWKWKCHFFSSNRKVYDWQHPSHENQFGIVRFTMKILLLFITLFFHFIVARPNNSNSNDLLKSKLMNCSTCKSPKFHGRDFYLPFCSDGQSFPNLCEAVCSNSEIIPTKGKIIYYISTQQVQ